MPPLNLAKKLKPARKAWKSFTIKIKSKLQNFHVPNSIKAATNRLLEFCSLRLFAPFKKRFLSKHPSSYSDRRPRRNNYNHLYPYQHYHQSQLKNRKVIYIDQLYATEPMSMQAAKHNIEPQAAETSRRNEVANDDKVLRRKGKEVVVEERSIYSIEDAWKSVVAKSPHLRGVDERADEFIYKFHEDRKLEKERSDLDFQEMLARSA